MLICLLTLLLLETFENSLVGVIDKIIAQNNHYYLLDASYGQNIFSFNENGKFLGKILNDSEKLKYKVIKFTHFDIFNNKVLHTILHTVVIF
jgi:hypothetical protein